MASGISHITVNMEREKLKFQKRSDSKFNIIILNIEKKTIIFDFDETLAKVHLKQRVLDDYDDQVDILTKE